ncbi:glycoside hydrolase family 2 TIM barrel-domain containing protein [Faecalibacterium prausnitzii]|uniref:glycoside hydrolase family 2 TIM barrel-domain containing protein n=1 Tax=Faecalibacterium prausnitzii TaxID=853 RepID=UPI003AAE9DA7
MARKLPPGSAAGKFESDPQKGFILNGGYPLRGVSRHQDRKGMGNALTKEMMEEGISIILEMGANTIRLAHYQHAPYFYDLCDEKRVLSSGQRSPGHHHAHEKRPVPTP